MVKAICGDSCQSGCRHHTLRSVPCCHLLSFMQQGSWQQARKKTRNRLPWLLNKSAELLFSAEANSQAQGGFAALVTRSHSVNCGVNIVLCVRTTAKMPSLQTASFWPPTCYFSLELASAVSLIIKSIWTLTWNERSALLVEQKQTCKSLWTMKCWKVNKFIPNHVTLAFPTFHDIQGYYGKYMFWISSFVSGKAVLQVCLTVKN